MTTWNGGDDPEDPGWGRGDFRDDVDPADPPPVTDAMITPRTSPAGGDTAGSDSIICRICGETNSSEASYCLACGVALSTTEPTSEPEPWDDGPELDFDDGLMDLGEMNEVTSLHPQEEAPTEPKQPRFTGRHVLIGVMTITVLVLLVATFRPTGDDTAESTTTTAAVDATALAEYETDIAGIADTIATLRTEANQINTDWDARTIDYDQTLTDLSALESSAAALPDLVRVLTPPDVVGDGMHNRLIGSAMTLATAADEMVVGLQSPDTGEARRAALAKFDAAAGEFASLSTLVAQTIESVTTTVAG